MNQFTRTLALLGQDKLAKLHNSSVVVFGVGGVGSFAVEALARAGVGKLVMVDYDDVCVTNINRQIQALHSTIGRLKVEVLQKRVLDINPHAEVEAFGERVTTENVGNFIRPGLSYVIDAIDDVKGKLAIIEKSLSLKIPVIAAMGAANRLDPTCLRIGDIGETVGCPLARIMRRELRKRGINQGVKVVYSTEPAVKSACLAGEGTRPVKGSISFVPPVAGMYLASCVVNDLTGSN